MLRHASVGSIAGVVHPDADDLAVRHDSDRCVDPEPFARESPSVFGRDYRVLRAVGVGQNSGYITVWVKRRCPWASRFALTAHGDSESGGAFRRHCVVARFRRCSVRDGRTFSVGG